MLIHRCLVLNACSPGNILANKQPHLFSWSKLDGVESGYNKGVGGAKKKIRYMQIFLVRVKLVQSATRQFSPWNICSQSPTCRQNAHLRAGLRVSQPASPHPLSVRCTPL